MTDDIIASVVLAIVMPAYLVGWYRTAILCIRENWAVGTCHTESKGTTPERVIRDQYTWGRKDCRYLHDKGCWRPSVRPSMVDVSTGVSEALLWPAVRLMWHMRGKAEQFVPVDVESIEARFARLEAAAGVEPMMEVEA